MSSRGRNCSGDSQRRLNLEQLWQKYSISETYYELNTLYYLNLRKLPYNLF
jgi:hypothetical protein